MRITQTVAELCIATFNTGMEDLAVVSCEVVGWQRLWYAHPVMFKALQPASRAPDESWFGESNLVHGPVGALCS